MQLDDTADTHCLNACVLLSDLHLNDAESQTDSAVELALQKCASQAQTQIVHRRATICYNDH